MIFVYLDDLTFLACETPEEAAGIARLLGVAPPLPPPAVVAPAPAPVPAPAAAMATHRPSAGQILSASAGHPKGRMRPTGKLKTCKKCGGDFPIVDRSDCASVYCRACRPTRTVERGIQNTRRACVAIGCGKVFAPHRASVVHCPEHRLGPGQNRKAAGKPVMAKAPVPTAGQPAPPKRNADPVSCRTCGASVPEFESIDGECLQCAPLARRKAS